ncbi:four helix bundle protein [Luteitalea pratensis]|uniref:Four helix bundle protein n=1 Tax=Luteitalea pratensis TaxID=1855912 RepID=A0A143PSY1_LUTPR|nr:four helix bundle protein [Luteitalea pratensis]AMY11491.1 four helix bundle protein [Luteitalea pratensis]
MSPLNDFHELEAWQRAMDLAVLVLGATPQLPAAERFGLGAQMRAAAVSIPSNIAEGYGRGTRPDYLRFLHMARGSANELTTLLLLVERLGYLTPISLEPMLELLERVRAMMHKLIATLAR